MRTPQKTTSVRRTVYNSLVVGVMVATVNNLAPDLALLWKIVVAIVGATVVQLVIALLLPPRRDQSRAEPQEDRQ